jgi:ABC-2 type transport system permease protein
VIAAISSEWLKIRTTRTFFWLLFALAALMTLIVVSVVISDKKADLIGAHNQLDVLTIGTSAVLIALIVGLVVSTGEFRHGTITPTLLSTPSRTRVVISKGIAAILFGVTMVAIAEALVAAELAALLPFRGIGFALQGGDVVRLLARTLAAAAIWGALGSALGLAFRNQIGTVVGCFVWLFVAEGLINAILRSHLIKSHAGRFLPLQATGAVFNTGKRNAGELLSRGAGLAVLCGWMALATVLALVLLERRDVS